MLLAIAGNFSITSISPIQLKALHALLNNKSEQEKDKSKALACALVIRKMLEKTQTVLEVNVESKDNLFSIALENANYILYSSHLLRLLKVFFDNKQYSEYFCYNFDRICPKIYENIHTASNNIKAIIACNDINQEQLPYDKNISQLETNAMKGMLKNIVISDAAAYLMVLYKKLFSPKTKENRLGTIFYNMQKTRNEYYDKEDVDGHAIKKRHIFFLSHADVLGLYRLDYHQNEFIKHITSIYTDNEIIFSKQESDYELFDKNNGVKLLSGLFENNKQNSKQIDLSEMFCNIAKKQANQSNNNQGGPKGEDVFEIHE